MLDAKLTQLNPRLVLSRGYAIVIAEGGAIVREAAGAPAGTDAKLMFARDGVRAMVMASPDISQE
jgi:exonuclease VII large subunit